MIMQIKPGYTNPLITAEQNKFNQKPNHQTIKKPDDDSQKVTSLQNRQMQLKSEMLLIKATGADTGQDSAEKLEHMEETLSDISDDLRAARADFYVSSKEQLLTSPKGQYVNGSTRIWRV